MFRGWMTHQGDSKRMSRGGPIVLIAALLLWPSVGTATTDNLKCFKIKKEQIEKIKYAVDLDGLKAETGCQILSKGMYLCVPSAQTNFSPPAPRYVPAPPAPPFVCYKAKCPKTDPPSDQTANDKFGSRMVQLSKTKWACVPLSPSSPRTRCCNFQINDYQVACYDFVPNVNSAGEFFCTSGQYAGSTVAPAGEVCGGLSGVCASEHSNGGSCCSISDGGQGAPPACLEGDPNVLSLLCGGLYLPPLIPNATCQVDGTCIAQ